MAPPPPQPGEDQNRVSWVTPDLQLILLSAARPPLGGVATPPPPLGPMRSQRDADGSQSHCEPDVEAVLLVLERALDACRRAATVTMETVRYACTCIRYIVS